MYWNKKCQLKLNNKVWELVCDDTWEGVNSKNIYH